MKTAGEMKTNCRTQHSVRELRAIGIQPDILLLPLRAAIPARRAARIALFCNVRETAVIQALDARSIYGVPLDYHEQGLDAEVLACFGIDDAPEPDLSRWHGIAERLTNPDGDVCIAVVGKYTVLKDAYKSLIEALIHGGVANNVRVHIDWVESEAFEDEPEAVTARLEGAHGVLVPGGFGERGAEGKIRAAQFAREHGVPYFGICFGMQLGRDRGGAERRRDHEAPPPTEFRPDQRAGGGADDRMGEGQPARDPQRGRKTDLGGSMRLGAYEAVLTPGLQGGASIYGGRAISERHRHRYEVNIAYREAIGGWAEVQRACRPTACCPRSSSASTIAGSWACSSTRN